MSNFVRGHDFQTATGLKTGTDLESLVTDATLADGAFDNNQANRIFDTRKFVKTTDPSNVSASNVLGIKPGGIDQGDISTTAQAAIAEQAVNRSDLFAGAPLIPLDYNMFSQSTMGTTGGTPSIPYNIDATFNNAFDGNPATYTSERFLKKNQLASLTCDLGEIYTGFAFITISYIKRESGTGPNDHNWDTCIDGSQEYPWMSPPVDNVAPDNRWQWNTSRGVSRSTLKSTWVGGVEASLTVTLNCCFTGRYIWTMDGVGNFVADGVKTKISNFSVYGREGIAQAS